MEDEIENFYSENDSSGLRFVQKHLKPQKKTDGMIITAVCLFISYR